MSKPLLKILFVCMGNICRSPTAEGVFRQKLIDHDLDQYVLVDSAGTHNYHPGSPPDERSQAHAVRRGYDLSALRARAVHDGDFESFDLLLTMDWDNRALLEERCPKPLQHKIRGFAEFLQKTPATVIPDPYYEGAEGFEQVLDLVEEASDGLLQLVRREVERAKLSPQNR
jgi:protein-tyrosine phosphatase